MFSISNDSYIIGDILCVVESCTRDPTGELRSKTHMGRSLILPWYIVCIYCKPVYTSVYNYARIYIGMQLRLATKLTYLMTACYTPNDDFTAKDASFYKNRVG